MRSLVCHYFVDTQGPSSYSRTIKKHYLIKLRLLAVSSGYGYQETRGTNTSKMTRRETTESR
jgi:hypothetical protein